MTTPAEPGTTRYDTPNDLEVRIVRVFDAPRALVYAAWTEPKHMQEWLLGPEGWTMPVCEVDLRPGGAWRFGWQKDDGATMEMTGFYLEVVPPARVVTSERWGPEWPETINTAAFEEEGGRTTVTLTLHYPSKEARDAALATGMKDGLDGSYARLEDLLAQIAR